MRQSGVPRRDGSDMVMTVILGFIKKEWAPVLLILVAFLLIGRYEVVVAERNHYQKTNVVLLAQISDLKTQLATKDKIIIDTNKQADLQAKTANDKFAGLTRQYSNVLADNYALIEKNHQLVKDKINADKELSSIRLSLHAVQLFNASKQSEGPNSASESSATVQANANAPETIRNAVTLTDLYRVVNDNDTSHRECIKQVEAWQKWWGDYSKAFNTAFAPQVVQQ